MAIDMNKFIHVSLMLCIHGCDQSFAASVVTQVSRGWILALSWQYWYPCMCHHILQSFFDNSDWRTTFRNWITAQWLNCFSMDITILLLCASHFRRMSLHSPIVTSLEIMYYHTGSTYAGVLLSNIQRWNLNFYNYTWKVFNGLFHGLLFYILICSTTVKQKQLPILFLISNTYTIYVYISIAWLLLSIQQYMVFCLSAHMPRNDTLSIHQLLFCSMQFLLSSAGVNNHSQISVRAGHSKEWCSTVS